jgi:hypothetical protein
VGDAIGDYAAKEQDKINKVRFNDAYNQALNEANRLKNEMGQYQGAEAVKGINGRPLTDHYRDELQKAFSKIGEGLSAPDLKDGFQLAADDLSAKFLRDTETYEVEQGRVYTEQVRDATIVTAFDQIAAAPSDIEILDREYKRATSAIKEKLMDGGYNADPKSDGYEAYQLAYKTAMGTAHTTVIDGLNEKGQYETAQAYFDRYKDDFMPGDAKMVQAAMDDFDRDLKVMGKADAIWAESGFDYGVAIGMAAQSKDPRERAGLEVRINTLKTQGDAAANAKQDTVRMAGMEPILKGGGMGSIPASVRREADQDTVKYWQDLVDSRSERAARMSTLSAEQKAALKSYEVNVVGSIKALKEADPDLYNRGPRAWMAESPLFYAQFMALDDGAKSQIEREIESSRTGGGKASAADGIYSQLVAGSTTFGVDLTKMKTENPDRYVQITGALQNAAEQEARALGDGALTVTRRKEIFGTVLSNVYKNEGEMTGFSPLGMPVGQLAIAPEFNASTEERRRALDIAALLPRDYQAARKKLIDKGNANPSEMEVATEALSMRARQEAKEAPPTFTQGDR